MRKYADNQTAFDFSLRGHRLRLLDRIVFPKLPGTTPAGLVAVLRQLDSHAREKGVCRLNVSTISDETKMGRRSVFRALDALEQLQVIQRKYTGRSTQFRIFWIRVADLDPRQQEESTDPVCHRGTPAVPPWHTSSATVAHQGCHRGTPTEAPTETPTQPPPERNDWQEAEEEVCRAGVTQWRQAVGAARQANVTPAYVLACVAYFQAAAGAFDGAGALAKRLEQAAPFAEPDDPATWPPPRPPSAGARKAFELLAGVRAWCLDRRQNESQIRTTFEKAAASGEYGTFAPDEIQRALFEAYRIPNFFKVNPDGKPNSEIPAEGEAASADAEKAL